MRESAQSGREGLLAMKQRGFTLPAKLAVGDGAMGFWAALSEVFPSTRTQRCWMHKTGDGADQAVTGMLVSGPGRAGLIEGRKRSPAMSPELIAAAIVLAAVILPGQHAMRRDVADLRKRMGRLEGLFDGFTRHDTATTPSA